MITLLVFVVILYLHVLSSEKKLTGEIQIRCLEIKKGHHFNLKYLNRCLLNFEKLLWKKKLFLELKKPLG